MRGEPLINKDTRNQYKHIHTAVHTVRTDEKLLIFILLLVSVLANAAIVDFMDIDGADYKLLHILNSGDSGYIYAENYQHKKVLIYKSAFPYFPYSIFTSEQIDNTDILGINFPCNIISGMPCTRFFNRRTNALSDIYLNILDYNAKKDVVAYFVKEKNTIVISRAFAVCKKPLLYRIKMYPNSDFGPKTRFMPDGTLRLYYAEPKKGDTITKMLFINYHL